MAEPAKIDLNRIKRGDTYIVDFFFVDTDGTKDITGVNITAQARRELDGALWFDLNPVKVDAANGHFRIHLTSQQTREITESPPGSFSGIYDIQFSWSGVSELYVSTIVSGSIAISKDVTYPEVKVTSGETDYPPSPSQEVAVYFSLNPGTPNYSDVVTAEELTPAQYQIAASLGLANVNIMGELNEAVGLAEQYRDEAEVFSRSAGQSAGLATNQAATATQKAEEASESALLASEAKTAAEALTDLATWQQYRDESAGFSEVATTQAGIATEQAGIATQKAGEAAASAEQIEQAAQTATTQAGIATDKANEAKGYRDEVFSLATETPTAGKVPTANSEGKIHSGWLPANVSALSQAVVEAIRNANKEKYAASGFVHWGKHSGSNVINEGLYADVSTQNVLYMGGGNAGESETIYPVMNVAGYTVRLAATSRTIKFPEAPDGTVIYDSSGNCRGTGKPTLNLLTEVDPKYGDVAADRNEAVARAFEGSVKNGDFRKPDVSDWVQGGSNIIGLWEAGRYKTVSTASAGNHQDIPVTPNSPISITVSAEAISGEARLFLYEGGNFTFPLLNTENTVGGVRTFTVTPTTNSLRLRLYCVGASEVFWDDISVIPATEEVVTERVDMFGFEFFKEKVGEYLYPYGCIQSQLTEVDGVPTTVDNSRPITYFAVFDGDTSSRGRGWRLADLTFVQLATIMSNPEHNAWYNEKGELVQFRVRQRTVAGAGNGDWNNVNSQGIAILFKQDSLGTTQPSAQGILDDTPDWCTPNVSKGAYYGINHGTPIHTDNGIFKAGLGGNPVPALALDGECYFYVCGTVPRLNLGLYHVSLNPLGCAADINGKKWYDTTLTFNSTADCFDLTKVSHD